MQIHLDIDPALAMLGDAYLDGRIPLAEVAQRMGLTQSDAYEALRAHGYTRPVGDELPSVPLRAVA